MEKKLPYITVHLPPSAPKEQAEGYAREYWAEKISEEFGKKLKLSYIRERELGIIRTKIGMMNAVRYDVVFIDPDGGFNNGIMLERDGVGHPEDYDPWFSLDDSQDNKPEKN